MDAADCELFTEALRKAVQHGVSLDDVGWYDALADDREVAVATLFELQGEHNATSTALDAVVADAAGLPSGRILLPALDSAHAPATITGGRVRVRGICRGGLDSTVIAATNDGYVSLQVSDLQLRPVGGMDPRLELVAITGAVHGAVPEPAGWTAGVAAGQLALAHELVGTSRAMLRLAREHALDREQFGRPIASFQAVRHKLAEAHVAVESAKSAADAAWHDPAFAAVAKAVAGRSARTVARHAQQVLAGIGFTTEHPLHRYIRRALVLDGLFGSSRTLTSEIGAQALRTRHLPRPIPL
jgi:hypothetical protein